MKLVSTESFRYKPLPADHNSTTGTNPPVKLDVKNFQDCRINKKRSLGAVKFNWLFTFFIIIISLAWHCMATGIHLPVNSMSEVIEHELMLQKRDSCPLMQYINLCQGVATHKWQLFTAFTLVPKCHKVNKSKKPMARHCVDFVCQHRVWNLSLFTW